MKKSLLLVFIFALLNLGIYADDEYLLGTVDLKEGKVNIIYVKARRNKIRFEVANANIKAVIDIPRDMDNFKSYVEKFHKWYKTAAENDYTLNKRIGELSGFTMDFITEGKKYELAFVSFDGVRLMAFDLDKIDKVMQIVSDENIDKITNAEKRKKAKENELFQ